MHLLLDPCSGFILSLAVSVSTSVLYLHSLDGASVQVEISSQCLQSTGQSCLHGVVESRPDHEHIRITTRNEEIGSG